MTEPVHVTGGTGRLGAPLVARLRAGGSSVRLTSPVGAGRPWSAWLAATTAPSP